MYLKGTDEQLLYSKILNGGMLVGLSGLVVTFILYVSGILEPLIPLEKVETYWILPVSEYLEKSGMQAGWAWFSNMQFGDMLNFLPIAFLSLLTVVCYIAILPGLIRKKDKAYVVIALIEILVLVFAASGILGAGSH